MKIVFIGAGNLATRLSQEMHRAGLNVVQVYSRTRESAEALGRRLGCGWTLDPDAILPDADLYVFSLKDAVLPELISRVKPNDALWVHTAGSIPMDIFAGHVSRYGVLYPLQTFSKQRGTDFSSIPFFLEATREEDLNILRKIARSLTSDIRTLSSDKRKSLHLAAVFACNFTNHMYALAARLLEEQDIPFEVLLPLIDETAAKVHGLSPREAQTGPAVRYDENVIGKHLDMLSDTDMKELYRLLSRNIHKETHRDE